MSDWAEAVGVYNIRGLEL